MATTIILTVTVIPTPCVQALPVIPPESLELLWPSSGGTVRGFAGLDLLLGHAETLALEQRGDISPQSAGYWPVCSLTAI